ncbi:Putative DNA ligase-like protein [Candidatus Nitrosocosmicus oleophilus]|uniref:DNA ligase n=1 Tax=Candidatus Nitrosocosmicus oleophilus TaxID=1353260 RepID=A0A654LSG3_9ARCH|nr:Putative DNA ligase-like protein [Candidatus Nitrosocosmicus oleophilus]
MGTINLTNDIHYKVSYFSALVESCESIRSTTSKNKKVDLIVQYISGLDDDSLPIAVLFLSGKIFPKGSIYNLNVGFRTILQSLLEISRLDQTDVMRLHLEHGDMGTIAEYAISNKKIVTLFNSVETLEEKPTLKEIYDQFKKIANLRGPRSNNDKKNILKGLLLRCSPLEAKYLVKIISNEMRIGSYDGLIEIAIAKAFEKNVESIREAMLMSGDIANVALLSKRDELNLVTIKPYVPMSFMLADVMFTAEEIVKYFDRPLLCEYKYDGIRVQMHKFGNVCKLYSRNLADISYAFPELTHSALDVRIKKAKTRPKKHDVHPDKSDADNIDRDDINFILDGELIAFKDDRPLPFQELQKRLRRKSMTNTILSEIPICYVVYDIMLYDQRQVIKDTLKSRKRLLTNFQFKDSIISIAQSKAVSSVDEITNRFQKSRNEGHEGLVIKDPLSQYYPGKRGKYWIKLKEELDTIDAVVVIAEYGHGKRAGTLSDYTLAVKDYATSIVDNQLASENGENVFGDLKIIGKAYSGLSNKEIDYMTRKLRSIIIRDEGSKIIVKPEIVLEISFDTIQQSDRHNSGYALRFPRIKNIRYDKELKDIDELEKIDTIYQNQFHIKNKSKP